MTKFSPFEATLWFATAAEAPPTRALQETIDVDVCIVGGGYTGLTTALELARKGVAVTVLEARDIGFGGSGRNAGHCTPTFTHYSLDELRRMLGEPWASRLIQRQTRANDRVSDMIARYDIDCEWRQTGYVMGAHTPSALPGIEEKARSYNAVGARTRVLDRHEVADMTGSPRFHGGWFHEEAGHLNALGYARGLARAVQTEGGSIYTASPVAKVERSGAGWHVMT
ncbi:MAG: NAD(P)/FAD-dependent oxidoreductase, partial [Phyllobacterium sp.]